MRHIENKVAKEIKSKTTYDVENVSPSSYSQPYMSGSIQHTGISPILKKHIEKKSSRPQKVVHKGLPDLICYEPIKLGDLKHSNSEVYEISRCRNSREDERKITFKIPKSIDLVNEFKFVEVKKKGDGLKESQVEWIKKFGDTFESEVAEFDSGIVRVYDSQDFLRNKSNIKKVWRVEK